MNDLALELGAAEGEELILSYDDGGSEAIQVITSLFTNGRFGAVLELIDTGSKYVVLMDMPGEHKSGNALPVYESPDLSEAISNETLPSPPIRKPDRLIVGVTR